MFVGWLSPRLLLPYARHRQRCLFTGTGKNRTVFRGGAVGIVSTLLRAETWGACRARVQHSAELCCVVVVLSPKVPCDGDLLHVVLPLHRFPACSPDRSRTGSTAQWDF